MPDVANPFYESSPPEDELDVGRIVPWHVFENVSYSPTTMLEDALENRRVSAMVAKFPKSLPLVQDANRRILEYRTYWNLLAEHISKHEYWTLLFPLEDTSEF